MINIFLVFFSSIGYPVVTLGFGFKSYVSYRMRVVSIHISCSVFWGKKRCNDLIFFRILFWLMYQILIWIVMEVWNIFTWILDKYGTIERYCIYSVFNDNNFVFQRKQKDVQKENDFYINLLQQALPPDQQQQQQQQQQQYNSDKQKGLYIELRYRTRINRNMRI